MKHWDQGVPARGIDLGVWMDAQADPRVASSGTETVVVRFPCWEVGSLDSSSILHRADYEGELRFAGVLAFRLLDGELGPYRLLRGACAMPECFFEVDLSAYDAGERISREASWRPSVVQRHDPSDWFEELDQWNPAYAPAPRRHSAGRHFVVVGQDAYFEVLASTYTFGKFPRAGSE